MSRLADAYRRRASAEVSGCHRTPDGVDPPQDATFGPLPWDLGSLSTGLGARWDSAAATLPPSRHCQRSHAVDRETNGDVTALVQRIVQPGEAGARLRSVMFVGVDAGDGSGTLCATVARQLTAERVCVIDANLHRSVLAGAFGAADSRGLTEILNGQLDVRSCLTRVAENLWLLPPGLQSPDGFGGLTARQILPVVRACASMFEYVLLDSAAATGRGADGVLLGTAADAIVVVLDETTTRRVQARRMVEQLRESGAFVLGAVLTNRRFPIPDRLYRRL